MNEILIIVDPQNDFLTDSLAIEDTAHSRAAIFNICEQIKKWNGDIIVTKDTHFKDSYRDTIEGKHIPTFHCIRETKGWDINTYIQYALDRYFGKAGYSICEKNGIGSLQLPSYLTKKYDNIKICGFCTDICVISNALILRAAFPNTPVSVLSSCCAGTTLENHQKALDIMKMNCIDVI